MKRYSLNLQKEHLKSSITEEQDAELCSKEELIDAMNTCKMLILVEIIKKHDGC